MPFAAISAGFKYAGQVLDKVNKYAPTINAAVGAYGISEAVKGRKQREKQFDYQKTQVAKADVEATAQAEGTARHAAYAGRGGSSSRGYNTNAFGLYSSFHNKSGKNSTKI